ncbi:MAG: tRNA 2-thiouridine(34) synthase MnmA [Patescibacteria group bacterium]
MTKKKLTPPLSKGGAGKIIVAMSGGVDSSVAAFMLKEQGYEVMGIFLHFWKDGISEVENKCCSNKALMDARQVCQKLGIPLYTLNFKNDFKKQVVDYFLDEYKVGNTPNPCVTCNKFVKLGLLIKRAREMGFDYVASGHYVNVECRMKNEECEYKLLKAKDKKKDQSYFLYTLNQEQLAHLLFPLGNYTKTEVRKIAKKNKLLVYEKSESQEICFIPEKSHNEFLKRHLKLKSGPIEEILPLSKGETQRGLRKVGSHKGLPLYTIGQRKGVEIGGIGPFYVAKTDYKTNTLYVVKDKDDPVLYSDKLIAENVNWVGGVRPRMPLKCKAVIRYRSQAVDCEIKPLLNPTLAKGRERLYQIRFKKPQRAVTSGQSVVLYKGNEILGGGVIK